MGNCRFLAGLLAVCLLLCLVPAGAAEPSGWLIPKSRDYAPFTDTKGTIAEDAARICCETGLMDGVQAGKFRPKDTLSNAQVMVICARLHKLLSGGSLDYFIPISKTGDYWYEPYAVYLAAEIPDCPLPLLDYGDEHKRLDNTKQECWRGAFTTLLHAVLQDTGTALPNRNHIAYGDVSFWVSDADLALYNAGISQGVDKYGNPAGSLALTRGTAASMLARVIDPSLRLTFTLETFDLCWDIFGLSPDTVLMTIDGTAVTADEFCLDLAWAAVTCDLNWTDCTGTWSRAYATDICREAFAIKKLAAERDVALTEDEIRICESNASLNSGKGGATEAGLLWNALRNALYSDVKYSFTQEYGRNNAHGVSDQLDAALKATIKMLDLKTTPAFDDLNFSAIREKLLATGYYYLTTKGPFR